jgi:hypothetical protein
MDDPNIYEGNKSLSKEELKKSSNVPLIMKNNQNSDLFGNIYDGLISDFSDQKSREKIEDIAVMLGSVAVAEAIPGVGEVQMALQFIDFIDPYGYNQALDRDSLNQLLTTQYQKIQATQTQVQDCYQNGNMSSCSAVGITSDQLASFQKRNPSFQEKQIKATTSWLTPYPPEVNYPQMYLCQLSHTLDRMTKYCQDQDYLNDYTSFYNANMTGYQNDALTAQKEAEQKIASQLSGDTNQDQVNTQRKTYLGIVLSLTLITVAIIIFFMLRKIIP